MTEKTKRVIKGYYELSSTEKREFLKKIRELRDAETFSEKRIIIEKINLGPVDDSCPCCGR